MQHGCLRWQRASFGAGVERHAGQCHLASSCMFSAPLLPLLLQHSSLLAWLLLQGKNGIFEAALSLFEALPLAVLVQDKTLILHGGLWRSQPKGNYKKLSNVPAAVRDKLGLGSLAELRAACSTKQGNKRVKGGRDPCEEGECAHILRCAGSTGSCLQAADAEAATHPAALLQEDASQPWLIRVSDGGALPAEDDITEGTQHPASSAAAVRCTE